MASKKKEVILGLVQMRCEEAPGENLDHALTCIVEAAREGAEAICLQELFRSRYFCQTNNQKFFELAEPVPGPTTEAICKVARDKKVVVVASLFEKEAAKYFNTACVIDADGKFLGKYRKVHIPDDPQNYYSEKFYFTPGDLGFKVFQTRYGKIGTLVCWDQWFPEGARALAVQGVEIIFYPTAIGWQVGGDQELGKAEYEAWMTVQRGHAISNTVFVAATNRTGAEDRLNFWGGSFVTDPLGRIVGQASHDQEENLIVSCDLGHIEEVRKDWPFLRERRTDVYETVCKS